MELEEMKTMWTKLSVEVENQKRLNETIIIKMTESRHQDKVRKILVPEMIASVVCLVQIIYILANFYKLDTWYLMFCGAFTAISLPLMAVISLRITSRLGAVNISTNNYKQSLQQYSQRRLTFVKFQKFNFILGFAVMLTTVPLAGKLFGNQDFFKETKLFMIYTIGFICYSFLASWVLRKYVKMAKDAENILKELDI